MYLQAETISLGTRTSMSCFSSRQTRSFERSLSLLPNNLPPWWLEAEDPCGVLAAGVENGTKLFFAGFGVSSLTSIPRTFNSCRKRINEKRNCFNVIFFANLEDNLMKQLRVFQWAPVNWLHCNYLSRHFSEICTFEISSCSSRWIL